MARYAEASDVAKHIQMWTDEGQFTGDTNPTLDTVESWLDDVSALMDAALASHSFVTPITNTYAIKAIKPFVESLVAKLAHDANKAGEPNVMWFSELQKAINLWVEGNALGLENMGAARTASIIDTIGYSDTDQSGERVYPITQRKGFGNSFDNWDTA